MMNIEGDYPLNSSVALIVFEVLKQFLNFLLKDVEDIFISCFRIFKHTSGEMSFLESGTIRLHYLLITREGFDNLCLTISRIKLKNSDFAFSINFEDKNLEHLQFEIVFRILSMR